MSADRYVVLGLSDHGAAWFRDLSHWSNDSVLPVEFVRCRSAEELRAQTRTGRRWSAIVVDGSVVGTDRDLLALGRRTGAACLVIDRRTGRDWVELGADAVLDEPVTPDRLLTALVDHATPVLPPERRLASGPEPESRRWQGPVLTVLGPGGAGTSTIAMALAQGLATDPRSGASVALLDFARDADQAFLHDVGDLVPGLPELVEAHRLGSPPPDRVTELFHRCPERGYDLLLGLRRSREWTLLRPEALGAAFVSVRSRYRFTVVDTDADLEGESDCGSLDIEERNGLARLAAFAADVVLLVGDSTPKGLHALVRCVDTLVGAGIDAGAVLPVLNRAPRHSRTRAGLSSALAELAAPIPGADQLSGPVFVPERRRLDDRVLLAAPLPETLVRPIVAAVLAHEGRSGPARVTGPVRVVPGRLGHLEEATP